jgi:hypothetical protein
MVEARSTGTEAGRVTDGDRFSCYLLHPRAYTHTHKGDNGETCHHLSPVTCQSLLRPLKRRRKPLNMRGPLDPLQRSYPRRWSAAEKAFLLPAFSPAPVA